MAPHTEADGFHEIQLNGKQLVFLFMAATVVSVVIFLCGVLVGRGVRVERAAEGADAAFGEPLAADQRSENTAAVIAPGQDPTVAPAPPMPGGDELSYPDRLKTTSGQESLKAEAAPVARAETPPPAPKEALPAKEAKADEPAVRETTRELRSKEPSAAPPPAAVPGPGFAVQVAALNVRSEADAIARRLSAKGYAAYVQAPARGTPSVYRVRVGTFKTKREADSIAARLKKEEKFSPWVTR